MKYESMMLLIYMLCPLTFGLIMSELDSLHFSKLFTFLIGAGATSLYVVVLWPIWNSCLPVRIVLYPLLLLAIIWVLCTAPPKKKLLFFLTYYLITMASEFSCQGYAYVFIQMSWEEVYSVGNSLRQMLMCAASPTFMMTYSTIYVAHYNKTEKPLCRCITVLMLLLLVSQCMFTVGLSVQSSGMTAEEVAGYAIACELLNIVVQYVAFETINRSVAAVKDRMELEHLKEKQAMDLKYIQMAQESAGEMSAFRHDFKNQLQVAYALLEEDPERAAVFLKELEEKVEQIEMTEEEM